MTAATDEAAAPEGATAAALRWICGLLGDCNIPFQVGGDVAAVAHGATRPVRRLELFVAAEHVPALLRAAQEQVTDYPWRRLDEAWDRVALSLSHDGTAIDVCVTEAARFKEAATGAWRDADIHTQASVTLEVFEVDAPVMPRDQLLEQITAARRTGGSGRPSDGP